jgi:predicted homoserine dehydrogenase-like protein
VLNGARIARPVKAGDVLTYDDVELDESATVVMLRRLQDRMVASGGLTTFTGLLPATLAG